MAIKKQPESDIVLLQVDKDELRHKVEERIQLGLNICERQISNKYEDEQMWTDFIDWNNLNEELIRQAFDKPKNIYISEYEYKQGFSIDALYGKKKTFQEEVEENKLAIKFQVRKLRWFYDKIELLKTTETITKTDSAKNNIINLSLLLNRFHKTAQAIRDRYNNRETILVADEYDVQDLLHGLLQIHFDDIRKEDSSPSHAGANSRLDFVLKKEKIIIEVKITNDKMTLNKLGQDLLVDIGRYKEYPECNDLVIFIYDKGDFIRNKAGFINDLQKQSTSKLKVTVIINPQ
jgi:REase_DpnII-MboI